MLREKRNACDIPIPLPRFLFSFFTNSPRGRTRRVGRSNKSPEMISRKEGFLNQVSNPKDDPLKA